MIRQIERAAEIMPFVDAFLERHAVPMLETPGQLRANLLNCIENAGDGVLGAYENGALSGVFSYMTEPPEHYIELLAAVSESSSACAEALEYLAAEYPGWGLDCVISPANAAMRAALADLGAQFYPAQQKMRLTEPRYMETGCRAVTVEDAQRDGYAAIHARELYWTAERVLASRNFRALAALDGERVVGYADFTCGSDENELYDIFVAEEFRNRGFGSALLNTALRQNAPNGMTLQTDVGSPAAAFFERAGFEIVADSENVTAYLRLAMQRPTKVYFVRYARADISNHDDASRGLSKEGLAGARQVAHFLQDKGVDAVLSSPYRRAVDTLRPFAERAGLDIVIVDDFRERRIAGEWISDFDAFVKAQWVDRDYALPGGESLRQAQVRSLAALDKVLKEYAGKTVAIGTHGAVLSAVIDHYDPTFGYSGFERIRSLMPWVVEFTFAGRLVKIRPLKLDVYTGGEK